MGSYSHYGLPNAKANEVKPEGEDGVKVKKRVKK